MKLLENLIELISETQAQIPYKIYVIPTNAKIKYWDKNSKSYVPFVFKKPIFFNLEKNEKKVNRNGQEYWVLTIKSINDGKIYSFYTDESIMADYSSTMNKIPKANELSYFDDGDIANFILSYNWTENEFNNLISNRYLMKILNKINNKKVNDKIKEFTDIKNNEKVNKLRDLNIGATEPTAKTDFISDKIKNNMAKIGVTAPTIGERSSNVKMIFSNNPKRKGGYIFVKNLIEWTRFKNNQINLKGIEIDDGVEINDIKFIKAEGNKHKLYKLEDYIYIYNDIQKKLVIFFIDNTIANKFKDLQSCDDTDDIRLKSYGKNFNKNNFKKIQLTTEFKGIG